MEPPVFFGGWGVKPATLRRVPAIGVGTYMIDLEQPGSGVISGDLSGFASLAQLVTWGDSATSGGRVVAGVTADPALPPPPIIAGKPINLGVILMQVLDSAGAQVDGQGAISVLVHAIPTQV